MRELRKYGHIRKFDDLGRIVIPKEIRNFLNIRENEPMEISVMERGIYIEKYQPLQTLESLCEQYLTALFKSCGTACAICSGEQVICSKGIKLSDSQALSGALQKHIRTLTPYHYSEESPVNVFDDGKYLLDCIYPVGTKKQPLGAVILLHYRSTTPKEQHFAELIANMLTELTINQP